VNSFIYLEKDTTIFKYKKDQTLNTGLDEILELTNLYSEESGHHISRLLVQFNLNGERNQGIFYNSNFNLNLKISDSHELTGNTALEIFPIKSNWEEGFGRRFDSDHMSGASWKTSGHGTTWVRDEGGGDYYTETELRDLYGVENIPTYIFNKRTSDVSFDITNYVDMWMSNILENNGLIIKFSDETINHNSKVNFFSKDTNTIYQPFVKVAKNDYIFNPCGCTSVEEVNCIYNNSNQFEYHNIVSGSNVNQISGTLNDISGSIKNVESGSCTNTENPNTTSTMEYKVVNRKPDLEFISSEDIFVSLKNIKNEISVKEQLRVRVNVREKYPIKKISTKSRYTQNNFVDYPMFYSVVDADTQERIIQHDIYTRISCDGNGHYFDFDFGILNVDRIYFFEIRVESPNQTKIIQDQIKFKVIR
tara:strand:- start:11330 stop:12589 length:1260 start_codon:yes stop_codon:yes gene_type:complete